jgi:exodeoxyribonuclease VII small subunit
MSEEQVGPRTFEESLLALERMVHELEDGKLGLDEALACYEQGVSLIKSCHQQLSQAEQRIVRLTGTDEAGQPILQPFQHEATAMSRTEPIRRLRRKADDGL